MTSELVRAFVESHAAVSGKPHVAGSVAEAAGIIGEVLRGLDAKRVALANLPGALAVAVEERARALDIVVLKEPFPANTLPHAIDEANVGVTGMAFGIAQSGTLVEVVLNDASRLVSALPRVHIGVVWAKDIVARLEDAAPRLRAVFEQHSTNCVVSFITGPSRTGDIELKLTLGVHGPGEAHAVIIQEQP
jgi:L-lactate dehydrogenase complex protein LldG